MSPRSLRVRPLVRLSLLSSFLATAIGCGVSGYIELSGLHGVSGSTGGPGGGIGGSTSGGTIGSTTGASGGCAMAGQACTPNNVCDNGTVVCNGSAASCQDDSSPNPSQNGLACGNGGTCQAGLCMAANGSTGTTGGASGGTENWPLIPNQGGSSVANPNVVLISYDNDTNAPVMQQFVTWVTSSSNYLQTVGSQYGVGNGTSQSITLDHTQYPAPTGTTSNQNAFPDYFEQLINANVIPAFAASNIYVLLLPASWGDTTTFCQTAGGYHTYYTENDGNDPLYAIIPNCMDNSMYTVAQQQTEIEVAMSHEIVEASTDPLIGTYEIQDPDNPWTYLDGEVADLCSACNTYYTGDGFSAQLIWSNAAVMAGQVPCQPWTATQTYYSLIGPATMVQGQAGAQVPITITGWSSLPSNASMLLGAQDGDNVDFQTNPQLSADSVAPGGTVTVTLSIPSNAQSGQHGAAWVIAFDPNSQLGDGSTMVGVVVQ